MTRLVVRLLGQDGLDLQEPVHHLVAGVVAGLVQAVDVHVLADPLGGGQLGRRRQGAVRGQGEQDPPGIGVRPAPADRPGGPARAAGLTTLELISRPGFHDELAQKTEYLVNGIMAEAKKAGIAMSENHVGGMFGLFFTEEARITGYSQAVEKCNVDRFKLFFHGMLSEGVYLAPSAFEAGFVSAAHTTADLDATIAAAGRVLATL